MAENQNKHMLRKFYYPFEPLYQCNYKVQALGSSLVDLIFNHVDLGTNWEQVWAVNNTTDIDYISRYQKKKMGLLKAERNPDIPDLGKGL